MFHRRLISVDDDYSILMVKKEIPKTIRSLFNSDMYLSTPSNSLPAPHPKFLSYHREHVFKEQAVELFLKSLLLFCGSRRFDLACRRGAARVSKMRNT